jgi:hypothetical protein
MCSGAPLDPEPVVAAADVDVPAAADVEVAAGADEDDPADDDPQAVARQARGMRHPKARRFNEIPFVGEWAGMKWGG